jgi:hypothetical protein
MTTKFLTLVTLIAFTTLLLAVVVIARISPPTVTAKEPQQPTAPPTITIRAPVPITSLSTEPTPQEQTPAFTQPLANAVNTTDLSNLAAAVHLKSATLADIDKNQWKTALPKAKQLLNGACDCEERNWLNHFVETGNEALSSDKEYEPSAKFLLTLPKNDEEAVKHVVSE